MKVNKIRITSDTGHFGTVLGYDDRRTYPVPPPSTVIGILQNIYNRDIDNFKFGYAFKSEQIFKDDITIHKKGSAIKKDLTNIHSIELHDRCELNIYTDISKDINVNYILCMGRAGNIARIRFPIEEVELVDRRGLGRNQFTSRNLGDGRIEAITLKSEYIGWLDSYDHQVGKLRFNKEFEYDKFYSEEEQQSIFMWEMKNGKVEAME